MGILFHLSYKDSTGGGVPSPVDGKTKEWPLVTWARLMPHLAAYGITVPILPPMTKGQTEGAGYDPKDNYDLGSKVQGGRRETRYGSIDHAQAFIAYVNSLGMETCVNVVDHHLDGDNGNYEFKYPGADGKTLNGRFPKDKNCFYIWSNGQKSNPDGVPDASTDWAFGREFLWNSGFYGDGKGANAAPYVRNNLIAALDWQTRRLGVQQYFLDDTKGTNAYFVYHLLSTAAMIGKPAFGEYSDGNTNNVMNWMEGADIRNRCMAMDFPLKYKLNNVLNNPGRADMRQLLSEGVVWRNPFNAVTFLDDADSDLSSPVISNKRLGYAFILTIPGYPMIFGKDVYQYAGCYGLMEPVMNLCYINSKYAKGDLVWRHLDYNFLIYERMGDATTSGMLCAVNNRPGDYNNPHDWHSVVVNCKWKNTCLHDETGNSNDVWTDGDGNVTLWLPPNDNGRGYVCFAPYGAVTPVLKLTPFPTVQEFWGAEDIDIHAAQAGTIAIGNLWIAQNSKVTISGELDTSKWDAQTTGTITLSNVAGGGNVTKTINLSAVDKLGVHTEWLAEEGEYALTMTTNLPVGVTENFKLKVEYTGSALFIPELPATPEPKPSIMQTVIDTVKEIIHV